MGDNTEPTSYTVTLTVLDVAGRSDAKSTTVTLATGPLAVCVPWRGSELRWHPTYTGRSVRLKGVAYGGIGQLTYTWNFGDGSPVQTGTVASKYAIEASHTYTASEGATFIASLTVEDSQGNESTDTYRVVVLAPTLDTKADVAIDEGLWWLHKAQNRSSGSYDNGRWAYYSASYPGSETGSALQAFMINGHSESSNDTKGPYADTVRRGLQFAFRNLKAFSIGRQTYGDPDFPYDGTGNGYALASWSNRMPYETGMVMDGIIASAAPSRIAWDGSVSVFGRNYQEILQDMVDAYSWGQYDDPTYGGGWRYGWNEWPDNSACQWAAIGMIPSTRSPWNCTVPDWVRKRNDVWLHYSYDSTSRWFGYTNTGAGNYSSHACRPSGMVQMVMSVDNYRTDSRWIRSEEWFAESGNWAWFISSRSYYSFYAFVKAMRLSQSETLSSGFNWYRGANGIAERLVADLESDGTWPESGHVTHPGNYGNGFVTAWAIVMLTPSLFELPPVADAGADIIWAYNTPLAFDGSKSYHLDTSKEIVLYEWDFDGDGKYDHRGEEPTAEYTYQFDDLAEYPVTFTAALRVTDNMGDADTDTRQVTISAPPLAPYAVIVGPRMIGEVAHATAGLPASFDGSYSFDLDEGEEVALYQWDSDGSDGFNFDEPDSTDATLQHIFAEPGLYTIGLRVWDNGLANEPDFDPMPSLPAYMLVQVEPNYPPTADAGGPYSVERGTQLTLHGSGTDPNFDPLTLEWDLDGDGEFDDSTDPDPTARWLVSGPHNVQLKVSDGLLTGIDATTVNVFVTLVGDANGDCLVNVLDLISIRNRLGKDVNTADNWKADTNEDGKINVLDLLNVRNRLGNRCK